jgi:hypothetical protein
MNVPAGSFIL